MVNSLFTAGTALGTITIQVHQTSPEIDILLNAETLLTEAVIAAIFIQALLSWIIPLSPGNRFAALLHDLTDPILLPIRRTLPPLGAFDLSPMVAIILVWVVGQLLWQITNTLAGG